MSTERVCVCVAGVLSPVNRLTRSADFGSAVRDGRRLRTGTLVVHLTATSGGTAAPRVGFVVSKAVGGSVVRHRVARRLRAGVRSRLHELPAGSDTVVRALPAAADASSARLLEDFDRALRTFDRTPNQGRDRS